MLGHSHGLVDPSIVRSREGVKGVHYLSDVLAGVAGGAFWLALSIALQTMYGERFAVRFTSSRVDRLGRRITRS